MLMSCWSFPSLKFTTFIHLSKLNVEKFQLERVTCSFKAYSRADKKNFLYVFLPLRLQNNGHLHFDLNFNINVAIAFVLLNVSSMPILFHWRWRGLKICLIDYLEYSTICSVYACRHLNFINRTIHCLQVINIWTVIQISR